MWCYHAACRRCCKRRLAMVCRLILCRSRRPMGVKRRRRHRPRGAVGTGATVISCLPARGRAFARPLADCGRIADLPGIHEPRNHPQFPRALSHKPPYPPIGPLFAVHGLLRTGSRACAHEWSGARQRSRPPQSCRRTLAGRIIPVRGAGLARVRGYVGTVGGCGASPRSRGCSAWGITPTSHHNNKKGGRAYGPLT